ncbi:hypothetical protein [Sulfuricurvum sp.]|uniref:hypothetical protein n=1 Tax=Sulfuricurvum sp. TaxID=2025608 RepID=UPI00261398BD|nr:hypothetical protein [Sulfuricurvum sp.]MDD3597367.1 hypothetical protein [Sulfuricurvum sp.]
MIKKISIKFIVFLTRSYTQIFIALICAVIAYCKVYFYPLESNYSFEFKDIAVLLASIASILALFTSIIYAFSMNYMNSSNNRIETLFLEFKNFLFKTDIFLDSLPQNISAVNEARALSYNLKFIKNDDLPINDWDERLEKMLTTLDQSDEFENDPNLGRKIMEFFGHLEYLLNEIGILRIKQIITGVFIKTLFKGFILLSLIIISILILFILYPNVSKPIMMSIPVFFGTFVSLLIIEIAWWIKREETNMLTFIEN